MTFPGIQCSSARSTWAGVQYPSRPSGLKCRESSSASASDGTITRPRAAVHAAHRRSSVSRTVR